MNQNGWAEHDDLPENWLYRRRHRGIEFVDPRGRSFPSKEAALKKTVLLAESDLIKLRKFQAPNFSISDDEFVEDINILPGGWKILREYNTNRNVRIISEQGFSFKTKRSALAHMIENNCSNEDIEKLQRSIEQDGWLTSPNLPVSWRFKKNKNGLSFSDPAGSYFGSREKALKFLRKFPEKNDFEITLLSSFQL